MIVTHAGEEDILAETVLTLDTEEDSEEKAAGDLTPDLDQGAVQDQDPTSVQEVLDEGEVRVHASRAEALADLEALASPEALANLEVPANLEAPVDLPVLVNQVKVRVDPELLVNQVRVHVDPKVHAKQAEVLEGQHPGIKVVVNQSVADQLLLKVAGQALQNRMGNPAVVVAANV